jgi:phage gpG-like protein
MTKATFQKGAKVRRWEAALANPIRTLKQIGAMIVSESQKAFRQQKHGDDKWEPRAPVNVYGIIADFANGSKPPARRFDNSKTLIDTGRLKGSIAPLVVNRDYVLVGTNLEYAHVLHSGGEIESEKITSTVRRGLWKFLKSKKGSEYKEQLGWVLNKKFLDTSLTGEVPARPIVGFTRTLMKDVKTEIGVSILEVK